VSLARSIPSTDKNSTTFLKAPKFEHVLAVKGPEVAKRQVLNMYL